LIGGKVATLVTGGTGFIGSNIVKTLAEKGHTIVSFDLVPPDELVQRYLKPWEDKIEYVQGNILKQEDLEKVVGFGITKIVHAAVFTGILPRIESSEASRIVDVNVMGTTNLLELARKVSPERFLYVSSGAVYGIGRPSNEILYEESPLRPNNLYSITKYTSELLTKRYGKLFEFGSVSVRLSGPYGPMEKVTRHRENQSLIKNWTGQALRGEAIEIDDRSRRQEATYVTDIAEGIVAILDSSSLSYDVYNNASGQQITLGEILALLEQLCPGFDVREVSFSEELNMMAQGRDNLTDITRLKEDVGFVPKFGFTEGLADYLTWCRAYKTTT
jgi:nucleoside-diphosphate-sugar epimerase